MTTPKSGGNNFSESIADANCCLEQLYDEDESDSGNGWISWFCDLEGHEFFIEVIAFFRAGGRGVHPRQLQFARPQGACPVFQVGSFLPSSEAMQMILSADSPDSEDLNDQK